MNRQDAAKLVTVILAACPAQSARLDDKRQVAMVDAYQAMLEDLSYEQCSAAARVLLQTRSWMPSVAEIRSTVLELERGATLAGGEAWGRAQQAIREQGAYRRPGVDFVFHDPTTARVVAALGWDQLCLSENAVADRARFIETYDKIAAQTRREDASPVLAAARDARGALPNGPTPIAQLLPRVPGGDS